uniref:Uncharacterized protein n=1 Tax=Phenylobacterium glaciei TaxID=2803784 RepID=A0A974P5C4_9CAUL|nr:hypothetical protein JKL49_09475 [Phenylobacterium glaciei]
MGQSYGAAIATLMAAANPGRVAGLVLLSGYYGQPGPTAEWLLKVGARMLKIIPATSAMPCWRSPTRPASWRGCTRPCAILRSRSMSFTATRTTSPHRTGRKAGGRDPYPPAHAVRAGDRRQPLSQRRAGRGPAGHLGGLHSAPVGAQAQLAAVARHQPGSQAQGQVVGSGLGNKSRYRRHLQSEDQRRDLRDPQRGRQERQATCLQPVAQRRQPDLHPDQGLDLGPEVGLRRVMGPGAHARTRRTPISLGARHLNGDKVCLSKVLGIPRLR